MPIKIDVKIDEDRINRRLDKAQKPMANQFLIEADRYVPKRNGTLRTSGSVSTDGKSVIYNTPYAHYQFLGVSKLGKKNWTYTTPGTGPRWDKQVKGNQSAMKNIADQIRRSF